jgi:outer membrane protein insertion porin family
MPRKGAHIAGFIFITVLACGYHEEFGIGRQAGERIEIRSFRFEGVQSVDESRLRNVLVTKPSSWLPWSPARFFDRDTFRQDLERIVAFYQEHGYPDAKIVSFNIERDLRGDKVDLRIVVDEGQPRRVDSELIAFDMLDPDEVKGLLISKDLLIRS